MDKTLRILMLEDNPADAELIQFEIEEAKIAFTAKVVMTEKDFIHALQEFSPHIILSDYDLPGYTGALALFEARKRCPDVPFILVTGAISEDRAIDSLTGGAKDYVMKSRLHRLAPAVRRALAEAEEQKARKTAEEELRAASHYSRSLIEASLDPLVTISPDGKVMDVNKATEEVTGVSRDQIIGRDFSDYFTEPEKARAGYKEAFLHGSVKDYPLALRHISGRVTEVLYNATTYMNEEGEVHGVFAAARDITRIRAIESELRETHRNLEKQIEARMHELQESKEHLRLALTSSMMGIFEWDAAKKKLHWDNNMHLLMGTRPENFSGTTEEMLAVIHPEDRNDFVDAVKKAIEQGSTYENEYRVVWPDGGIHHVITRGKVYQDKMNHPVRIIGIGWDVTEKQQAEKALRESREQFRYALETSHTGAWNLNLKDHSASRSLEHDRIFGYTELLPQWTYEIFLDHILPEDRDAVDAKFRYAVQTGGDWDFDCRIRRTDGEVRWIWAAGRHRKGSDGDPPYLFGIVQDITERKLAEEELEKKAVQLEATNKELESFSYSVSHDLQAPLRAIEGFSRMILKKHGDRFDEETRNRFEVIRTNTEKMRQLIEDLLAFSRLGRKRLSMAEMDMGAIVREAWDELRTANAERPMILQGGTLPPAMGDRGLIGQVVRNILSNAVKFTKPGDEAIVEVGAYRQGEEIIYTVKDNGIGFDMQYHDRLFELFKQLHSPEEYEGTGVGLALVQRIIHRHGGRVWAEGKVNEGATFYFTLPGKGMVQ